MCNKHYVRWTKGTDLHAKSMHEKTPEDRFWGNTHKTDNCWLWKGSTRGRHPLMYGILWDGNKHLGAHRFSYEIHNGPIPLDYSVCHTCDNPLCVNPSHLFLGTHTDNMRDKLAKNRCGQKNKTHCPQGHEYNQLNTYTSNAGSRHCRICAKLRERVRRSKLNVI